MKTVRRRIKREIAVTIIAVLAITGGMAQPGKDHHHGPGGFEGRGPDSCHIQLMVDDLAKELSLTDQQEQKILEIHYTHMQEMKDMHGKYKNDCVGEREAHHQLMQKLETDIKSVLTSDQQPKYDEFIKERHRQRGAPPEKGDMPPGQ